MHLWWRQPCAPFLTIRRRPISGLIPRLSGEEILPWRFRDDKYHVPAKRISRSGDERAFAAEYGGRRIVRISYGALCIQASHQTRLHRRVRARTPTRLARI